MATTKKKKKNLQHADPKKKKVFKTSKDEQTAPIINNASIYRAGRNPTKANTNNNGTDDDEMIANSYHLSTTLNSSQQPTFVDALKRRRDVSGRIITKSQLISHQNRFKQQQKPLHSSSSSSPIKHSSTNNIKNNVNQSPVQFNEYPFTKTNENNQNQTQKRSKNVNTKSEQMDSSSSDDSDSDDFDMENLTVPTVESTNDQNQPQNVETETDQIRKKFKEKLQTQKAKELESNPVILPNKSIINSMQTDNHSIMDDDSDSDGSAYETASSSEESSEEMEQNVRPRLRFLNKAQREKIVAVKPSLDEEAEILEAMEEERQRQIKAQTSEEVLEYIRKQEQLEKESGNVSDDAIPNDSDDDIDGEEGRKEFELWKLREIKRNLRDEEIRKNIAKEKEELIRRRNMTDAQILRENERLGIGKGDKSKKTKIKFMQKYYHKGVFYRDGSIVENSVLDRNFNAPTGQDKYIDFEKVPEAMKTKNFGKMSQSKWTHLANEDTTFDKEDRAWFNNKDDRKLKDKRYAFRYRAEQNDWMKRGGQGGLERPSYKKGNMPNANRRFEKRDRRRYGRKRDRSRSPHRRSRKDRR